MKILQNKFKYERSSMDEKCEELEINLVLIFSDNDALEFHNRLNSLLREYYDNAS
jgi:hypothetical protein